MARITNPAGVREACGTVWCKCVFAIHMFPMARIACRLAVVGSEANTEEIRTHVGWKTNQAGAHEDGERYDWYFRNISEVKFAA